MKYKNMQAELNGLRVVFSPHTSTFHYNQHYSHVFYSFKSKNYDDDLVGQVKHFL